MTARTRQQVRRPVQDSRKRASRKNIYDKTMRTWQQRKDSQDKRAGDAKSWDWTAGKGLLRKNSWDKTAGKGQLGKDN